MPRGNRTGPMGFGPTSGRGRNKGGALGQGGNAAAVLKKNHPLPRTGTRLWINRALQDSEFIF